MYTERETEREREREDAHAHLSIEVKQSKDGERKGANLTHMSLWDADLTHTHL